MTRQRYEYKTFAASIQRYAEDEINYSAVPATSVYLCLHIPDGTQPALEAYVSIDDMAKDGWRLHSLVYNGAVLLAAVLERDFHDETIAFNVVPGYSEA